MSAKTVKLLREEKKKELAEVIAEINRLEKEVNGNRWDASNKERHVNTLRELDRLYRRRRELKDFLKEVDGKRLITRGEEVMRFEEMQ